MREEINWSRVFSFIPEITGLPVSFIKNRWYGACYLDGSPHNRWDKIVIYLCQDGIRVLEQGGGSMSLHTWLVRYGGCACYKDAFDRIKSESGGDRLVIPTRIFVKPILKHVPIESVGQNVIRCNLFKYLCGIFGNYSTVLAWDKYKVGSSFDLSTVFWYINAAGECYHDKKILYLSDGHRDKQYGARRTYKVDNGYIGKCYFGEHCIDPSKRTCVVESEKSAIGLSIIYPQYNWIATGGSMQLRDINSDWVLFPDNDDAGKTWESKYPDNYKDWYSHEPNVEVGNDFFDIKVRKYLELRK